MPLYPCNRNPLARRSLIAAVIFCWRPSLFTQRRCGMFLLRTYVCIPHVFRTPHQVAYRASSVLFLYFVLMATAGGAVHYIYAK